MKEKKHPSKMDKRTKDYKEWKAKDQAEKKKLALGDTIEKFTEATGIKSAVKYVFGKDCGCEERQEKVNTLVSRIFGRKHVKPLTEVEYEYIKSVEEQKSGITPQQQKSMQEIWERVFDRKLITTCSSCSFIKEIYNPLIRLIHIYDE